MQLTLFDADYAGGNISWCGQTWTQAEVQAGATKCACPTAYNKSRQTYTLGGPTTLKYSAQHRWFHADLHIQRQYNVSYLSFGFWAALQFGGNFNLLSILGSQTDRRSFYGSQATRFSVAGFPNSPVTNSDLNIVLGVVYPLYNSYDITDTFFGSHTIGGVEYTWAKGLGWP
jgi:hypothetical protein